MKVKLIQYSGIPVRITNRCKQNSAGSTQYDRQRVLRPINRRIASPSRSVYLMLAQLPPEVRVSPSQHGSPSTDSPLLV